MRCSEARRRLIKSRGIVSADDRELKEHLLSCTECAAFARAEQALCRDLATAADEKSADEIPLSYLRTRVEARADSIQQAKTKENSRMSTLIKKVKKRPSLGITFGVAAVVLALATLVPFSFDNTVGYEVAIAGVDKDLAMDSEKINELIIALGLENVNVDVGDCEATCVLKISELETEGDVDIIVKAFDEMGNCVLEDISEIHGSESSTLLKQVHKNIFITEVEGPDGEEVHQIVIDALCHLDSAAEGEFSIWVTDDCDTMIFHGQDGDFSGSPQLITIDQAALGELHEHLDGDGNVMAIKMLKDCSTLVADDEGVCDLIRVENDGDGNSIIIVTDDDGNIRKIDLDAPDVEEQLAALGMNVNMSKSEDGTTRTFIMKKDGDNESATVDPDEALEKMGSPSALPDGLELKQNHPNPFNPTTRIAFNLPETQDVLLDVYNVNGQRVRTLVEGVMSAGEHSVEWDSKDDNGRAVASGVYLYRLTAGNYTTSKKMTLLK
jgi:hypothetical protein